MPTSDPDRAEKHQVPEEVAVVTQEMKKEVMVPTV